MTLPEYPFPTPPCAVCGERPGTVRMIFAAGPQRRAALLCETCAAQMGRQPAGVEARSTSSGATSPPRRPPGRIDPVDRPRDEIAQTVEILARRRKNNAVLIGEAGVGKTAIAEGLALRIHENDVPEGLQRHPDRRARSVRHGGRRPVPRPVRAAPEGGARGGVASEQDPPVHRRAAHAARRRQRRGRDGRRQHPQAAAGARRPARDRRDHAGRVPQDRARLRAGPALLARCWSRSRRSRTPSRSCRACAAPTRRTTACSSTTRRSTRPRGCRTATSPSTTCPTRRST